LTQKVIPGPTPDAWSADALHAKALRYADKMIAAPTDSWDHALWSGLCLELLARAALSNLSPALLAETKNDKWSNLAHALGFPPFEQKFSPTSIPMTAVLTRLRTLLPDFDTEMESFCSAHIGRRNEELHSGSVPYDGVNGSSWHGPFYRAASVLLSSMGYTLKDFIGDDQANVAEIEIAAAADEAARAVIGEVQAHQKVWSAKSDNDRIALRTQASAWATRSAGHRVDCPSCGSPAVVVGQPVGEPKQALKADEITETQEHLPHWFQCVACGLKIVGLSRLQVVGLGDRYLNTRVYEVAEYYAPTDDYADFEEDNNEPF
jgi:hypothetical protein